MTEPPFVSTLGNLASELMTLEINTIVKCGMTASKMPELPIALRHLANGYTDYLLDTDSGWPRALGPDRVTTLTRDDEAEADRATFERLVDATGFIMANDPPDHNDERSPILHRIRSNSQQILAAMPTAADGDFTDKFRILVRKAWDVGTEVVVMQTSLQLDGDVITRVSPILLQNEPERFGIANPNFVSTIHHGALTAATAQWRSLFELAAEMIGDLGKKFFTLRG